MRRSRTRTSPLARLVLSAALLWAPVGVNALGLGKLTLHSGLDEPLSAEIELTAVTSVELKTLRSGLAPRAEFEAAGVEWASHLTGIKYTVATRADGTPVLQLSSDQPIREPFLHFLLQVEWTGGRLIREYTALLDPPYLAASKPVGVEPPAAPAPEEAVVEQLAAAETAPATQSTTAASAAATEQTGRAAGVSEVAKSSEMQAAIVPMPGEEEPSAAELPAELLGPDEITEGAPPTELAQTQVEQPASDAAAPRRAADWATATEYGPVKKGDTLWRIAERLRADKSLSLEQTMLALMKANKQAFIGNNMNHLKTGKILKAPDRAAVESVSHPRALREFRAQYDAWQEYKLKLASTSRTIKVAAEQDAAAAKGVIAQQAATAQDPAPAAPAGAQESTDLLKIVRANLNEPQAAQAGKPAGGKAEQAALADRVAMLEEALESKELENKELRERLSHLETQIKNAQRLIEIESARLAQAQQQAGAAAQKPAATAPAATPPAAATPATTPTPAATATAPAPAAKPTPPPAAKPPAPVAKKPAPTPVVEEERNLIDDILNNPMLMPAAGGLGAIVAGTLFLYYRRRRRSMAEFEESILSGGGLNSEGTPSNPNAAGGDVSLLSDFSQGGMGNIHTDEVDPIAEAEVYLAYGRDEQAEEILREAIVKDPQRLELRQKLAEIYHQRNDLGAFETLAEELYAALGGKGGKAWDKVADMGRKMNPANPMFRGGATGGLGGPGAATAAVAASSMFSAPETAAAPPATAPASVDFVHESAPAAMAEGLDFLSGGAPAAEASPASTDFAFDMDLAESAPAAEAHAGATEAEPLAAAPADISLDGLDMDFGSLSLESSSGGSIDFETPAASPSDDDMGISFDAESFQTGEGGEATAGSEVAWNMDEASLEAVTLEDLPAEDNGEAFDGLASSDEIATKLDLAKAYIDMGDGEGARSILDEVLAEGNDAQKQQAADLAAQIA